MNNQELQQEIEKLKDQVARLTQWKDERIRQQITFPLDQNSLKVLGKYFLGIVSYDLIYFGGAAGRPSPVLSVVQDKYRGTIGADTSVLYSVDIATDICTIPYGSIANTTQVMISTTDTQPAPLIVGNTYYVRDSSGSTFKLENTIGGGAINITSTGVGKQFIDFIY